MQFTDTSLGSPTMWWWDFDGDGTVDSTLRNPTHVFETVGSYSPRLVVASGNSQSTRTAAGAVRALGPVIADFTASSTNGNPPFAVTFPDACSELPNQWAWDFGDGGSSTLQNPTHNYNSVGTYTVALTATGPGGAGTVSKNSFIAVSFGPPVVTILPDVSSGTAPVTVNFTLVNTGGPINGGGNAWTFGDPSSGSNTSRSVCQSHTYTAGGSYTVQLTATGPGGIGTDSVPITVATPTFTQIFAIIQPSGAGSNCTACHTTPLAGGAPFSMVDRATAYTSLVNVTATTGTCVGTPRVNPGNAAGSTSVQLLEGATCGQQMFGFTANQILALRAWINAGAPNN